MNAPPAALLDARYRVGSLLARGGMSTVYRGVDTRLDRPVAIKVLPPLFASDPERRKEMAQNMRELLALSEEARAHGVADRPEIKRQLELTREFVLFQTYVQKQREAGQPAELARLARREQRPERIAIHDGRPAGPLRNRGKREHVDPHQQAKKRELDGEHGGARHRHQRTARVGGARIEDHDAQQDEEGNHFLI